MTDLARELLMFASLPFLCACSSLAPQLAPQQEALPQVEVPGQWSAVSAHKADMGGPWWERFDDPPMSALIVAALVANTDVNVAQAALQQARAQRDVAAAALWPRLDGSASAQRGSSGGQTTGNRFQIGLDATWLPDVFGATRSAVRAAEATVQAGGAGLDELRAQISAEVALNYILLRSAQARLAIAADNLASQQQTLQITEWREQAGLVTALEAAQARAAAAQTAALLPQLQVSIDQTRHALAVLSGQAPAVAQPALIAVRAVPQLSAELSARMGTGLPIPADTLRQRADVRAAEYQVAAAMATVDQAEAQRWPSFSIGGSLALSAASLGSLTHGASVLSSLLAGISLPVFDGGSARAGVRVQQALLAQAGQRYRATVLGALKEVEDALVALREDRLRLASLGVAADAAGQAAQLARQRYGSGLVDFQTVLETQRTQLSTQDGLTSAGADISADQVRLFRALGGDWQLSEAAR